TKYSATAAYIEHRCPPIDVSLNKRLLRRWDAIRTSIAADCPCYEGRVFKQALFDKWLTKHGLAAVWPRLPSGKPSLDRDTFKDMMVGRPEVEELHVIRSTLSQLKLSKLLVGADGRNRAQLAPFGAASARNTPS